MRRAALVGACMLVQASWSLRVPLPSSRASALRPMSASTSLPPFAPGPELAALRAQLVELERQLDNAVSREDYVSASRLRSRIEALSPRDPQRRLAELWDSLREAVELEDYRLAARLRDETLRVKRHLPQYQLAGLWRGLYPHHGEETIRIRYAVGNSDMLIATKVTGDEHVPKGEITFRVELLSKPSTSPLCKVVRTLSDGDAVHERDVQRFPGQGRIAEKGFAHPQYVDGEFFLMDVDMFGFLWTPMGSLITFTRVDPREAEMIEEVEAARAAAAACATGDDCPPWDVVCDLDEIIGDMDDDISSEPF